MEQIGRYLVRGEIGKGGFGAVYRAWDPVMRRDVAIKVLTSVNDPSMLARFRSEPATAGVLKHKNGGISFPCPFFSFLSTLGGAAAGEMAIQHALARLRPGGADCGAVALAC